MVEPAGKPETRTADHRYSVRDLDGDGKKDYVREEVFERPFTKSESRKELYDGGN